MTCAGCGFALADDALNCPGCQRLVHAGKLEELAAAGSAGTAKQWSGALDAWRAALALLPPETRQFQVVTSKIAELETLHHAAEHDKRGAMKWVAVLGPIGLIIWKFKVIISPVLTKGKLLLLGLTNLTTLSTMGLSLGFYWTLYGWWFALGFILSIYVHEMGHVWELRRFGIPASAPMFIPGIGAMVFLKAHPSTPGQDARVGLAGPIWGTAAALFCLGAYGFTQAEIWLALARWGAWINLFNLVPVWQLDGAGRLWRSRVSSGEFAWGRSWRCGLFPGIRCCFCWRQGRLTGCFRITIRSEAITRFWGGIWRWWSCWGCCVC